MNDIKIGGKNIPKPALYASGAVAVGIIGYAYWNKRKANATPATDPNAIDPSIDPETGLPYADEFGGGTGTFTPSGNTYNPDTGVTNVTNTNAAWAQAAGAYLIGLGYDPAVVGTALGKALNGLYITADEVAIWSAAIAFEGYPPQGYPGLNTTPPAGQGGGGGGSGGGSGDGGGGGGTTPAGPPKVTGKGPVTGLKVLNKSTSSVTLDWNPVSGAKGYALDRNGARIVSVVYSQGTVSAPKAGTSYVFGVTPIMSNGQLGTKKTITASTAKAAVKPKLTSLNVSKTVKG